MKSDRIASDIEITVFLAIYGEDDCDSTLFIKELELEENMDFLPEDDDEHPDFPRVFAHSVMFDNFDIKYASKYIGNYEDIYGGYYNPDYYDDSLHDKKETIDTVVDYYTENDGLTNNQFFKKVGFLSKFYIQEYIKSKN